MPVRKRIGVKEVVDRFADAQIRSFIGLHGGALDGQTPYLQGISPGFTFGQSLRSSPVGAALASRKWRRTLVYSDFDLYGSACAGGQIAHQVVLPGFTSSVAALASIFMVMTLMGGLR